MNGTGGWSVSGGSYDPNVSRSPGSGSLRFDARFNQITSATVAVTPGQPVTLSAFILSATWPSGNVTVVPMELDAQGGFVRVINDGLIFAAPGVANQWQEVATSFVPSPTTNFVAFVANRWETQFNDAPVWLDDLTIANGVQTRAPETPKRGFSGSQTRVDGQGNWEVLENGTWKAWFPLCVAANSQRPNFDSLAAGGFNCDIWNGFDPSAVEKAKASGMRSFFQLAQYYLPTGWAYRNAADLTRSIQAVNASPAADYLAGYWMDNEAPWGTFDDYELVARTVHTVDQVGGVRRRPIVQLMNSPYSRAFSKDGVDFSDVLAGYAPGGGTPNASQFTGNRLLMRSLEGQNQPVSLCQIYLGGQHFRQTLFGCIAHGGTSASYWVDGRSGVPIPDAPSLTIEPVEQSGFWSELPAIRREVDALLPVIRTAESTTWKVSNSTGNRVWPIASSTREVGGVAHMILANMTPSTMQLTLKVEAGSYEVGEIRDYYTNEVLAVANNGTFVLRMSGSSLQAGTRVVKLVPKA